MNAAEIYFQPDASNPLLAPWLAHCHRSPDAIAICGARERITYAGLYAAAASFATGLHERGIGRDDIVAFDAEPAPDTVALMLAIAATGAAWLPVALARPDPRVLELIEQTQPALLVGDARRRVEMPITGVWARRGELLSPQIDLDVKPSGTLAYVLFDRGPSGRAQSLAMRTRTASALLQWQRSHARLGKPARTLQFAAFDSEVAFQEIFCTLSTGGTVVLANAEERRDLSALLALLRSERVERAFLPSAVLEMLAAVVARRKEALPGTLLDVIATGKQLSFTPELRELIAALHQCELHIHYGPLHHEAIATPTATGAVMPHARTQPGGGSGAWQRSSVAARTAALLRAARASNARALTERAHERPARQGSG